jgi:hypothetical protein
VEITCAWLRAGVPTGRSRGAGTGEAEGVVRVTMGSGRQAVTGRAGEATPGHQGEGSGVPGGLGDLVAQQEHPDFEALVGGQIVQRVGAGIPDRSAAWAPSTRISPVPLRPRNFLLEWTTRDTRRAPENRFSCISGHALTTTAPG